MADLIDLSGIDLSGLGSGGTGPSIEELLSSLGTNDPATKSKRQDAKFRSALRQIESTDKLLEQLGEAPVPKPTPSLIFQAMDVLDTPRQYLAGGASKLFGVDGYKDISLKDAAAKAAQENLTTAEILEKTIMPGETLRWPRAGIGFVGDVLTDPFTYLTGGTGGLAKAGGRALTKVGAELSENLVQRAIKEAAEGVTKALPSANDSMSVAKDVARVAVESLGPDALQNPKVLNAIGDAAMEADSLIGQASNILNQIKGAKRAGAWKKGDAFTKATLARKSALEAKIGAPIEEIFAPSAIRIASPFGKTAIDIPGVTGASAKAFEAIGDVLAKGRTITTAKLDAIDKGLKASGLATGEFLSSVLNGVRNAPKLVSRSAAAGSAHAAKIMGRAEIARAVSHAKSMEEADMFFTPLTKAAKENGASIDSLFEEFGNVMASAGDEARRIRRTKEKAGASIDEVEDSVTAVFHRLLDKKTADISQKYSPALGQQFKDSVLAARNTWAQMSQLEEANGTLSHVIEEYFPQMYRTIPGLNAEEMNRAITGEFAKSGPAKFSMERVFMSLAEAQANGFTPNFNIRDVFTNRLTQHKIAEANRVELQRLALETGLSKSQYRALQFRLASPDPETAEQAKQLAIHLGFAHQDDMMKQAVRRQIKNILPGEETLAAGEAGIKSFFRKDGSIITPEHYQVMKEAVRDVGLGREIADWQVKLAADAKAMGFKFESPHELLAIERANELYRRTNLSNVARGYREIEFEQGLGKVGAVARGLIKGGLRAPENAWLNNYLPTSVVRVLDESAAGLDKVKKAAAAYKKEGGLGARYGNVLENMAASYLGFTKALKWGFTQPFLAFTVRNISSMPHMMAKDISLLGEAMNPMNFGQFMKVMHGKADLRTDAGKLIPHWQLNAELMSGNLKVTTDQMLDTADAMSEVLKTYQKTPKFDEVMRSITNNRVGSAGAKVVGAINRMNEGVENTGRAFLYYNLRRRGFSPADAIAQANDTMINYATGKTGFERTYLNNMLLFYSFSRHQTANSLIALATKPGAITGQGHLRDAITHALTQEDTPPLSVELEDVVRNVRSKESLSSYVGRSSEGLPLVMSQVGLPIEDLARFTNPRTPRDYSYRGITEAVGLTVRDSLRMIASQMHPAYKTPIEIASGKNLYFDRPLTDKSVRTFRSLVPIAEKLFEFDPNSIPSQIIKGIEQGPLTLLGARDNGDGTYSVNPYAMTVASSFIPLFGRSASMLNAMADPTVDPKYSLLRGTTGIKVAPVDLESSAIFDRKMKQLEMLELSGLPTSKRELMKRIIKERQSVQEEE